MKKITLLLVLFVSTFLSATTLTGVVKNSTNTTALIGGLVTFDIVGCTTTAMVGGSPAVTHYSFTLDGSGNLSGTVTGTDLMTCTGTPEYLIRAYNPSNILQWQRFYLVTGSTWNISTALPTIGPSDSGGVIIGGGSGNVSSSGTPAPGQLAVWTDTTHTKGQDKLVFDARDYGCAFDQVTDDTGCWKQVMAAASTHGHATVTFPDSPNACSVITDTIVYEGTVGNSIDFGGTKQADRGGNGGPCIIWRGPHHGIMFLLLGANASTFRNLKLIAKDVGGTFQRAAYGFWADSSNTAYWFVNSATRSGGSLVTVNTATTNDITAGEKCDITGANDSSFNATQVTITPVNGTTFTYPSSGSNVSIGSGPLVSNCSRPLTAISRDANGIVTATISGTISMMGNGRIAKVTGVTPSSFNGVFKVLAVNGNNIYWIQGGDAVSGSVMGKLMDYKSYPSSQVTFKGITVSNTGGNNIAGVTVAAGHVGSAADPFTVSVGSGQLFVFVGGTVSLSGCSDATYNGIWQVTTSLTNLSAKFATQPGWARSASGSGATGCSLTPDNAAYALSHADAATPQEDTITFDTTSAMGSGDGSGLVSYKAYNGGNTKDFHITDFQSNGNVIAFDGFTSGQFVVNFGESSSGGTADHFGVTFNNMAGQVDITGVENEDAIGTVFYISSASGADTVHLTSVSFQSPAPGAVGNTKANALQDVVVVATNINIESSLFFNVRGNGQQFIPHIKIGGFSQGTVTSHNTYYANSNIAAGAGGTDYLPLIDGSGNIFMQPSAYGEVAIASAIHSSNDWGGLYSTLPVPLKPVSSSSTTRITAPGDNYVPSPAYNLGFSRSAKAGYRSQAESAVYNLFAFDTDNSVKLGDTPGVKFSGPLLFPGSTSGSASIGVAAAAGTPSKILLPSTDPTSGQVLKAATPSGGSMQTSWGVLTKTDVGLGNVDNTADVNKPISNSQITAIQNQQGLCNSSATGNDSYSITLTPAVGAYAINQKFCFIADVANTGSASLVVSGLAAKTIKKPAGGVTTDLANNDIRAGQIVTVIYDGTNFQMVSQLGNAGSGASPAGILDDVQCNNGSSAFKVCLDVVFDSVTTGSALITGSGSPTDGTTVIGKFASRLNSSLWTLCASAADTTCALVTKQTDAGIGNTGSCGSRYCAWVSTDGNGAVTFAAATVTNRLVYVDAATGGGVSSTVACNTSDISALSGKHIVGCITSTNASGGDYNIEFIQSVVVGPSITPTTLTDAATVTWATVGVNATLTFTVHGGSRTLNLSGLVTGNVYLVKLIQDGTGGENLTGGTGCTWKQKGGGSGTFTLTATAGAIDILTFYYDGTNCYANLGLAYN
jgi:hypothetical protein